MVMGKTLLELVGLNLRLTVSDFYMGLKNYLRHIYINIYKLCNAHLTGYHV